MERCPTVSHILQRASLVTQVSRVLRDELARRRWKDFLPGQRALCEFLQVSRPTLHNALATLEREGLVEVSDRRRTRIMRPPTAARPRASRIVTGLIRAPLWTFRPALRTAL